MLMALLPFSPASSRQITLENKVNMKTYTKLHLQDISRIISVPGAQQLDVFALSQ
ncbi:hypothetical protein SK128_026564, partial [Halocaridina rubra]